MATTAELTPWQQALQAARDGDLDTLIALHETDPSNVMLPEDERRLCVQPFLLAAKHPHIIQQFLDWGVDPVKALDEHHQTILHYAAAYGCADTITLVAPKMVEMRQKTVINADGECKKIEELQSCLDDFSSNRGLTPLHLAVINKHLEAEAALRAALEKADITPQQYSTHSMQNLEEMRAGTPALTSLGLFNRQRTSCCETSARHAPKAPRSSL